MPQFAFTICHLHQCPALRLHILVCCAVTNKCEDFLGYSERLPVLAVDVCTIGKYISDLTIKVAVCRRGNSMPRLCGNRFLSVIGRHPPPVGIRIDNGFDGIGTYRSEHADLFRTVHALQGMISVG